MGPVSPKVRLLWATPEPQKTIALAARMCYSALPVSELAEKLDKAEIDRMVQHILSVRHYSVLRHVVFMFSVEGVSRSFSHQLVRHHVGVDVEQRSQHYRRENDFSFNLPSELEQPGRKALRKLYEAHMAECLRVYNNLIACGLDKAEARQVLPNGCETQLVITMNLNAIINVLQQRACRLNTPEILKFAILVRKLVLEHIPEATPFLGPTCWTQGICFEGETRYNKSCQRPWRSPTVLWNNQFPRKVVYVGLKDGKHVSSINCYDDIPVKKVEPSLTFQASPGKDSKNNS